MPERQFEAEKSDQEDPRKKYQVTTPTAALTSTMVGGIFGGIAYGAARFFANPEIAERLGLGVGFGIGGSAGGLLLGIVTHEEAKKLAIKGQVGKATLKSVQGSVESGVGMASSGFIAGWEASGLTGGVIGAISGTLVGGVAMAQIAGSMRELGIAHRDVIMPTKDPNRFPSFGIVRDPRFNEENLDSHIPPVYIAPSIGNMKGFRRAQIEEVITKSETLPGRYKNSGLVLTNIKRAIFIIKDVAHYPVYDPKTQPVLFSKFHEPSELVQLNTPDDVLVAHPYKELSRATWPFPTEFAEHSLFSTEQWQY